MATRSRSKTSKTRSSAAARESKTAPKRSTRSPAKFGINGPDLYRRAKTLIPGGTQLLSKRPEMFLPEQWPSYYAQARGVEVVALDGRRYIDMGIMGIGACILGYADPEVDSAAHAAIDRGVASTLNAPEEVELAELLCELHPWADMVRYSRGGGEAMAMAVRIARAHTRKDKIVFSGYHGWADWYLAANLGDAAALDGQLMPGLEPAGVARGLKGSAIPFHYNRLDQLEAIVREHRDSIGVIVMEPRRDEPPEPGFLEQVRQIASDIGAVLIFDEITTGFRMTAGGIHKLLGVDPDIAVFSKAMANGYAMSAVIGRASVMEAAQSTFISSTNWTERIGPSAAIATIRKYVRERAEKHITRIGAMVMKGWNDAAKRHGVPIHTSGLDSLCHFSFTSQDDASLVTLFDQLLLERGYLAFNQFKPSFAHQESHVRGYLKAVDEAFAEIADALEANDIAKRLKGPVVRRGFYRLTR